MLPTRLADNPHPADVIDPAIIRRVAREQMSAGILSVPPDNNDDDDQAFWDAVDRAQADESLMAERRPRAQLSLFESDTQSGTHGR